MCEGGREKRECMCKRGTGREVRRVREVRVVLVREEEVRERRREIEVKSVCMCMPACACRHTRCWWSCQHVAYMWRSEDLQWISGSSSFHFAQDKVFLLLLKTG